MFPYSDIVMCYFWRIDISSGLKQLGATMNNVVGLQNILFMDGSGHNAPSIITALTEVLMFNISKANVYASVIG